MDEDAERTERRHQRRLALIWEVFLFQFKLLADGVRDLLLSPVSIAAALLGLLRGGDDPDQYFRSVQRFGRRSDLFINLFGHYKRGPNADRLVEPLQQSLEAKLSRGGWLRRRADQVNALLDTANDRTRTRGDRVADDDGDLRSPPLQSAAPGQDAVEANSSSSEVR